MSRFASLMACGAVGALVMGSVSACGSDTPLGKESEESQSQGSVSGTIAGSGASSQEAAHNAWRALFTQENPDATVTYDPVGSGAGIEQFASGQVSWAASDAVLTADERKGVEKTCGSPAWHLPLYISPGAFVFHLEGIDRLNLSPETLAKIFSGSITKWNDPEIAADNPKVDLPDTTITPVHRADESGTTENVTDYLHKTAPKEWPHEPAKAWPLPGGEAAPQTSGLISTVSGGEGTIGYADASQVGKLGAVALKVGNKFVPYSAKAAARAADKAASVEGTDAHDLAMEVPRTSTDPSVYPLVLVSYEIVCSNYSDKAAGQEVVAYMRSIASKKGQQAAADNAGSAPISESMRGKITKSLSAITFNKEG